MKIDANAGDEAIVAEIGARVARLRIDQARTQAELAADAGVSKRTLERLENGESVQLTTAIRVFRVLGVLAGIDAALFAPETRPSDVHDRAGQRPQRAPRAASREDTEWTWGDDA